MDGDTTPWTRVGGYVERVTSGLSRQPALLAVGMLAAGFLWTCHHRAGGVAFALAVGLAAA